MTDAVKELIEAAIDAAEYFDFYGQDRKTRRLRSAISVAQREQESPKVEKHDWIPVQERMPNHSRAVLVHCGDRHNTYTALWICPNWIYFSASGEIITEGVDCWQELPKQPASAEIHQPPIIRNDFEDESKN